MIEISLVGSPTTVTARWLQKYFGGEAVLKDFAKHFSENYRSSKGTVIPPNNVYSRIRRDESRGVIVRKKPRNT